MFDSIMIYSAVDVTLYIRCMLWGMCRATCSCAPAMTRFFDLYKIYKKQKNRVVIRSLKVAGCMCMNVVGLYIVHMVCIRWVCMCIFSSGRLGRIYTFTTE
jgi:hypothetical protein